MKFIAKRRGKVNDTNYIQKSKIVHLLLLPVISIAVVFVLVYIGYNKEKKNREALYLDFYYQKALHISQNITGFTSQEMARQKVMELWNNDVVKPADEYLCIVDSASCLLAHTKYPESSGNNASSNAIIGHENYNVLLDVVQAKANFLGRYTSSRGESQIAAFVYIKEFNWLLGIHRSYKELSKEVNADLTNYLITVILSLGILLPLSIILMFLVFKQIIKEKDVVEQSLKLSEKKFREIIEMLPEVVYECDRTAKLTLVNQVAYSKFGYSFEDMNNGLSAFDMITEKERNFAKMKFEKSVKEEKGSSLEFTALRKDGSSFPAIIYSGPVFSADKLIGFRGVIVDISERKKYEEELKTRQAVLEGLVHDRTKDLENKNADLLEKNDELEKYNTLFVGREFRINELKEKIIELEAKNKTNG